MPVTQLTRFGDLVEYLKENNVPHRADAETQVLEVPVNTPPGGVMLARWEKKLPYVQLVYPFVADVPDGRVHDVEAAICRANNTIALPGLGFEYHKKFIYMRLCVPMYAEGMLAASFQQQIVGVIQNAKDFIGPLRDIVAGAPGDQIMDLAMKHAAAARAAKP